MATQAVQDALELARLANQRYLQEQMNDAYGQRQEYNFGRDAFGQALQNFISARNDWADRRDRRRAREGLNTEVPINPTKPIQSGNATGSGAGTFTMDNNGIDSMPQGYSVGSPIGANGTDYSFPFRQGKEPNDYTFQNAMPTEQNGFHLGNYPQTEMYGDQKDWQRQMVRNAAGLNGESRWFNPGVNGDNTMNIKDQGIGQNYNQRINSQIGSFYPQAPNSNVNSFGQVFQNADKSNAITVNPNFQNPSSDNVSALTGQGQPISGAENTGANATPTTFQQMLSALESSKYLGNDYGFDAYNQKAKDAGIQDLMMRRLRYAMDVEPLRAQAREDRLRETFRIANDPNVDNATRTQALAALSYELKNPDLVNSLQRKEDEFYARQGMMRNPNYSDGDSEYGGDDENARAIYSHLASKGIPANVIAGIMGNLQAESGFNSSAVGDGGQSIGLAQWYDSRGNNLRNFAKQRGKEWNDIGTQVDFLLDEIQQSNPDLLQRMAKLSPHEAAILFHDEFERSADTPEMKARRGEYASNIFNGRRQNSKYVRDPNYVSPREKFNAEQSYRDRIARAREYKAYRTSPNNTTSSYGEPTQFNPVEFDEAKASFASSPNEKSGDMIARGLSSRYIELLNKSKGNAADARQKLYEEIKKDKSIGGALEGNEKAFRLMWDITINAEKYATGGGQGGEKPQSPEQKNSSENNTNKPGKINAPAYKEKNNYVFTDPLDEVHDYGVPPLTMAEIAKSGGKIGDGQIENMFDRMFSEAGSSKVTPKRKR